MNRSTVKVDSYRHFKRWMARLIAVALWYASIQFSIDGFDLQAGKAADSFGWLAWILAIFVTIAEIVWNGSSARKNWTIFTVGILAYGYGIFTNVTGFYVLQGNTLDNISKNPSSIIFALVVGIIAEIVPEAFLVWSILDDEHISEGDFLGNLLGKNGEEHTIKTPSQQRPQQYQNYPQQQQPSRGNGQQNTQQKQPSGRQGQSQQKKSGSQQQPQQWNRPDSRIFDPQQVQEAGFHPYDSGNNGNHNGQRPDNNSDGSGW